jgi:hypothetical protein
MNARMSFFVCMAITCACASAQTPGPPAPIPQPIAPSTLPHEAHRYDYDYDYPYTIDHGRYEYDKRGPCLAQNTSRETSESSGSNEGITPNTIDWCALAPYQPRYAPQVPAAWWWHHRASWRQWRPR